MKGLTVFTILLMVTVPAVTKQDFVIDPPLMRSPCEPGPGFIYCYPGPEQLIQLSGDGVSRVLATISSSDKRLQMAEKWFQLIEQSYTKTWQFQKDWLALQAQHLNLQKELEQRRMETMKLQAEIEKLKAENLKLEKENLELRLKLQKEAGQIQSSSPAS